MHFDQFLQYRVLAFKFGDYKGIDNVLENPDVVASLKLRTVCTALDPSVFERLDGLCQLLEIPKRRFAEMALIEAMERAESIIKDMNAFEFIRSDKTGEPA